MRCLLFYRQLEPSKPIRLPGNTAHNRQHSIFSSHPKNKMAGVTLLELLAVIALLAILSTAALVSFDGTDEQARSDLTRQELAELRKAVMQFRRDNRELPCRVYRDGQYQPDDVDMTELSFPDTTGWVAQDYADWCANADAQQDDNALSMLNRFPFGDIDAYKDLLWKPDIKLGWNGPYISQEGLTDAWGNGYRLLDPELDYSQAYRCRADGTDYYVDSGTGNYSCLTPNDEDEGWDPVTYILPANVARVISSGPNGQFESVVSDYLSNDPCVAQGDDLVLCLLR